MRIIKIVTVMFFALITQKGFCQNLDLTFGDQGKAIVDIGTANDYANSVIVNSTGEIFVSGYSYDASPSDFSIIKLSGTGVLDNSFSGDGKLMVDINSSYDNAIGAAILPDGNLMLGGETTITGTTYFSTAKILTNGSLDNSYNTNGKTLSTLSFSEVDARAVTAQSDGKILIAGNSGSSAADYDFTVIRLNTDGSYDNTFGTAGIARIDLNTSSDNATDMILQPNGKIILLGRMNSDDAAIVRLNIDGTLDAGFGTNGKKIIDFGTTTDAMHSISLQKDGKILIAGGVNNEFAVMRLNADGSSDNSFGSNGDGKIFVDIISGTDMAYSIKVDTFNVSNNIFVSGYSLIGSYAEFSICRISASGNVEAKLTIPFGSVNAVAKSSVVLSDGKILLAGYTDNGNFNYDYAIAKVKTDFSTSISTTVGKTSALTNLNLFPNPASQTINVHSSSQIQQIKVMNIMGNEVLNQSANGNTQVDISGLSKGLYNFVITTDQGIGVKKISVQ